MAERTMGEGGDGAPGAVESLRRPEAPGRRPETKRRDGRSVGRLVRDFGEEGSRLIREEMELARAEMREKLAVYEKSATRMLLGGVMLLAAAGVLLVALNRGLTMLLEQFLAIEVAVWLAPLILTIVFGLVGWAMVASARRAMSNEGVAPKKTIQSLREERDWAKREAKEMRNG